MQQEFWIPAWIRGSRIEDIVCIGKNTLAWCTGVNLIFFDIPLQRLSLRWCRNQETGEGAQCLSGHSILSIFCFAEKIIQPRILVYAYPSMTKISECVGGCQSGYLATAFTMHDQLVSVGSYPQFPMILWSWRTGEKLVTVNTSIRDNVGQIIRVTQIGPMVIAQMGKTCGKLTTWELDVAGKMVTLKDHEVNLPDKQPILWVDWSPTSSDPLLALTDSEGHIFLSNYDGSDIYRIILSQRCGVCLDLELPIVRWFQEGIVLRTTFCQIRFFAKNARTSKWEKVWYVKSMTKPCVLVTHPFRNDCFFYHTLEGYLMKIGYSEERTTPVIEKYLDYGAIYRFADFVYPWCHHLVVTDNLKELVVVECYSGTVVSMMDLELDGEITSQASHPDYPMIVLGTSQGGLVFVNFLDPEEPKVVASMRLQQTPLDLIKFSHSGRSLLAAEKMLGTCYCINLNRDNKAYTVQALLQPNQTIVDALIYEGHSRINVLMLFMSKHHYSAGQQLALFLVPEDRNLITNITAVLELPGVYQTLWQIPTNAMILIGSPYKTRFLRMQRIQDFKDVVALDGLMTGHHVKLANLFVDRNWITTAAFDGLAFVRDKNVQRILAHFMTHHRADFGSVKTMANRSGNLIVCLGYNGSLVAMRPAPDDKKENPTSPVADDQRATHRVDYTLYEKHKKKILSDYASLDPAIEDLLLRRKVEIPDPQESDKTWTEWRDEMQLQEERVKCAEERAAILRDFDILKAKVKKLLDDNETCPEIEKLPLSAFDLDITGRDQKLKAGRDTCENIRMKMEHNCSEMDRVSSWIRRTFWDPQVVVGKSLTAMLGSQEVTNYPSVAENPLTKAHLEWAHFSKDAVRRFMEGDTFQPWKVYTQEQLQIELNKRITLHREEDLRIDLLLDDEEDKEVTEEEISTQRAWEGTIAYKFIETSPCYSQLESYGFDHVMINNRFLMHDSEKLRAYFNKAFDEVYALKEREMNVIRERIERIHHINSELKTMFQRSLSYVPPHLRWHWQERPEGIITVLDHEVDAKPYISPSQQGMLDKQAAEEERIRLLLLADDFRERALMAMMDGVLEVRWEDIIKIDVPKPACMLEKKPENYTSEDIQTVKRYEKDVKFLQEERERYNRMLDAEYIKVMGLLREGVDKFNGKLDELFRLKISIESAINQIHLRYVRGYLRNYHRIKALRQEEEVKQQISEKRRYEATLQAHVQAFRKVHQEFISQHETLSAREKTMPRRFKTEFSSLTKLQTELLERQYKRRPRTNLRNLTASDFLDLESHVVARTRSTYLPSECNEYLRALDHLDVRPNVFPPTIVSSHWEALTRLRRQRIEMELKVRAKEIEIIEVENVIYGFEQKIEKCGVDIDNMTRDFDETRRHRRISDLDVEIQLVVKMGQLEIKLNGDLDDTEKAILVTRSEIERVNEFIRAAGECKLEALSQLLNFRRGTLLKEWKHECQRHHLEDLQEDLRFLESVTVTKEMQLYLKRKARGFPDDKTPEHLSDDIEATKRQFEKIVVGYRSRLQSIEKEISITRSKNEQLDRRILEMNVARCEMELRRDRIGEARQREHMERKIRMIMRRSRLIKKLQDNYAELLMLQTEHELLRLRRYPTFHFKTLDDEDDKKDHTPRRYFCPC
ncbi:cilia- and flagella-associated protein 43-like [Hylaeus anthracinus]|uniref:cilia- and flagella-associated protein 43-like n=1 Tax=Hylaeus anthracinus TaxID=313031 RepID=UPI0023B88A75|nr:cilia- and flagella-associated protein 43-like [Hylaeus anthracinus]